jgi:hypothetical protein
MNNTVDAHKADTWISIQFFMSVETMMTNFRMFEGFAQTMGTARAGFSRLSLAAGREALTVGGIYSNTTSLAELYFSGV